MLFTFDCLLILFKLSLCEMTEGVGRGGWGLIVIFKLHGLAEKNIDRLEVILQNWVRGNKTQLRAPRMMVGEPTSSRRLKNSPDKWPQIKELQILTFGDSPKKQPMTLQ